MTTWNLALSRNFCWILRCAKGRFLKEVQYGRKKMWQITIWRRKFGLPAHNKQLIQICIGLFYKRELWASKSAGAKGDVPKICGFLHLLLTHSLLTIVIWHIFLSRMFLCDKSRPLRVAWIQLHNHFDFIVPFHQSQKKETQIGARGQHCLVFVWFVWRFFRASLCLCSWWEV